MSAGWVILALIFDRHCGWMAVLVAADIALMLRLARAVPGRLRALTVVAATIASIMIANWGIASAQVGGAMGFGLIDSAQRLGPHFALTLAMLANHGPELAWYGLAIIVAIWLGR